MATPALTEEIFEQTVGADGILVFSQPGGLPTKALKQVITAVRELDMDDLRTQVAATMAVSK